MTPPKQTANDLVLKYAEELKFCMLRPEPLMILSKRLAIIHVDGIIEANPFYFYPGRRVMNYKEHSTKEIWKEVKQEIELL